MNNEKVQKKKVVEDDVLEIDGKSIDIQYSISNWGEAFGREKLKKEVIKVISDNEISASKIEEVKVSLSLNKYMPSKSIMEIEASYTMEDITVMVKLSDGKDKIIPLEHFIEA